MAGDVSGLCCRVLWRKSDVKYSVDHPFSNFPSTPSLSLLSFLTSHLLTFSHHTSSPLSHTHTELLLGPTFATSRVLQEMKLSLNDIGVIEFHEAFAGQVGVTDCVCVVCDYCAGVFALISACDVFPCSFTGGGRYWNWPPFEVFFPRVDLFPSHNRLPPPYLSNRCWRTSRPWAARSSAPSASPAET